VRLGRRHRAAPRTRHGPRPCVSRTAYGRPRPRNTLRA
jgi:hypothetical protein